MGATGFSLRNHDAKERREGSALPMLDARASTETKTPVTLTKTGLSCSETWYTDTTVSHVYRLLHTRARDAEARVEEGGGRAIVKLQQG